MVMGTPFFCMSAFACLRQRRKSASGFRGASVPDRPQAIIKPDIGRVSTAEKTNKVQLIEIGRYICPIEPSVVAFPPCSGSKKPHRLGIFADTLHGGPY